MAAYPALFQSKLAKISENTKAGSAAPHSCHTRSHAPPVIAMRILRIIIHDMIECIAYLLSIRF